MKVKNALDIRISKSTLEELKSRLAEILEDIEKNWGGDKSGFEDVIKKYKTAIKKKGG